MNEPPQHSKKSDLRDDDSVFERPRIVILDEKQWHYLRRRYRMTPRELQVAKSFCEGYNHGEIVNNLKITHGTVKTHLRNLYRKIRVKNKIEMLLKFMDDAAKSAAKSGTSTSIPIVEIKRSGKGISTSSPTVQKD